MKNFLLFATFFLSLSAMAQSNEALTEVEKYNLTPEVLTMTFNEDWPNVSFEKTSVLTTVGDNFESKQVSSYDASKPQGQKWTMVSVNGAAPNNDYIKQLDAEQNGNRPPLTIDPATLKKVNDDDSGIIYSYKYNSKSIPKNYPYLKDCTAKATINKSSGKLEKIEITNDGPTKMGPVKLSVVKFLFKVNFDASLGQYIITGGEQTTTGKFLGTTSTNNTTVEYKNIQKVN